MKKRIVWAALTLATAAAGCKSQKEIGAEVVDKKLDLVEGAADELGKRGQGVGRNAAKAIGDTLKGVGSGVKDTLMPPIAVTPVADLPVKVAAANLQDGHQARLVLEGTQPFKGGLWLEAKGADGATLGRSVAFLYRELSFAEPTEVTFAFTSAERLSLAKDYVLHQSAPKSVSTKDPNVKVNQLSVIGSTVKTYAVFDKAFTGSLELRALDAQGGEVGRATEAAGEQPRLADSAGFVTFAFAPETELARVESFELKLRPASPAKK